MSSDTCCQICATTSGCCCCLDEDGFRNRNITQVTPYKDRRCTDCPCLLLLLAVISLEIFFIFYASENGANVSLFFHGYDYQGVICEQSSTNNKPFAIWPDIKTMNALNIQICEFSCDYTLNGALMITHYKSIPIMNAFCIPTKTNDASYRSSGMYERAISDLDISKYLILIMAFSAIAISYFYLKMISVIGRFLLLFTFIIISVGGLSSSVLLMVNGIQNYNGTNDDDQSLNERNIGIIQIAISCLLILVVFGICLVVIFLRKKIYFAMKMLKEASISVRDIRFTLIFPIFYSIFGILYIAFWITETIIISSVRISTVNNIPTHETKLISILNTNTYITYAFNPEFQNIFIFHIIVLYFMIHVIIYFLFMVLSGVFADWYFSEWETIVMNEEECEFNRKLRKEETLHPDDYNAYANVQTFSALSKTPISDSILRILRYHLGSLSFGSLIVTIIRIMRAIFGYIRAVFVGESCVGDQQRNCLCQCLLSCVECCLGGCECIFNKANKEGFIFTSVFGSAYCYSSYHALKLLLENVDRSLMVEGISHYTEFVGRLTISFVNTAIAAFVLKYYPYFESNVSSILFPCAIVFVMSYIIAALFLMVIEVSVETLFLCYLLDDSVNQPAKYASYELHRIANEATVAALNKNKDDENASSSMIHSDRARQFNNYNSTDTMVVL